MAGDHDPKAPLEVRVRRIHRRDLNRAWDFLKRVFRDVNRETVEYQRPLSKRRFVEIYDEEAIEQLLFEVGDQIVGYAECAYEAAGDDNWVNPRYFDQRGMRPLFVEELAAHPDYQGKGVGTFMLEQLRHLARLRGCTHLVLEVAENNKSALQWYRKRNFYKLDAAIFMAQKISAEPELLPPRRITTRKPAEATIASPIPAETPSRSSRGHSPKPSSPQALEPPSPKPRTRDSRLETRDANPNVPLLRTRDHRPRRPLPPRRQSQPRRRRLVAPATSPLQPARSLAAQEALGLLGRHQ